MEVQAYSEETTFQQFRTYLQLRKNFASLFSHQCLPLLTSLEDLQIRNAWLAFHVRKFLFFQIIIIIINIIIRNVLFKEVR